MTLSQRFKSLLPSPVIYQKADYIAMVGLSGLFSFFMVFGESFYKLNSWDLIFGSFERMVISSVKGIFYFLFFIFCFYIGWHFLVYPLAASKPVKEPKLKVLKLFDRYPFQFAWLSIFLLYIPYFIAFYPGMMMGDSIDIIAQGFNLPDHTSNYLNLIDPTVTLNQHHSVAHTLLLHFCLVFGHGISGSWNVGLYTYSMLQACIMISAIAFAVYELKKWKVPLMWRCIILVYFTITPRIQTFMFLCTKDSIYSAVVLVFILCFYRLNVYNGFVSVKYKFLFLVALLAVLLFRNDSKYLILIVLISASYLKKGLRKMLVMVSMAILVGLYCYTSILLPTLKISPGSRREMLSIPFQQTARYLRDVPEEEITDEEKSAISNILDYDKIKMGYDPELSDAVKSTFNENATKQDMSRYFKVWFRMLCKHPGIYIQATMNNVYDYFYPLGRLAGNWSAETSSQWFSLAAKWYAKLGINFDFNYSSDTKIFRDLYELYRVMFRIFPFSLLETPSFYTWICMICFTAAIKDKRHNLTCLWMSLIVTLFVCIAGPCNGWYFRYLFPVVVCLPFACAIQCTSAGAFQ